MPSKSERFKSSWDKSFQKVRTGDPGRINKDRTREFHKVLEVDFRSLLSEG